MNLLHWLMHTGGLDDLSGPWYGFWSGIGSDIGELTLVAGGIALYRKHNCHVSGCPRIGKHPVDGTPYTVCRKHHPVTPDKVTPEHVHELHRTTTTTGEAP